MVGEAGSTLRHAIIDRCTGVWGEGGVSLGLCETGRRDTRTESAVRCTCEQRGAAVFDTGGTQRGGDTYRGQAG